MRATNSRARKTDAVSASPRGNFAVLSRLGVAFMQLIGRLPLPWVRALGWVLGWLLYGVAGSRRRVVWTNLKRCFPHWPPARHRAVAQKTFIHFAQAWLDRGWLWHGRPEVTRQRLRMTGSVQALQGDNRTLIFAPHFVGLDAGWTALTQAIPRRFTTIYTHQGNRVVDDWVLKGRQRFGNPTLFDRIAGPKPIVVAVRAGEVLYLLPDMNYGLKESVFVPFFGVPAATVTSLSRLARLGQAQVVPVVTRLTRDGYEVQVMPAWTDFPGDDAVADTLLMNQRLEAYVNDLPDQYYWVHKRFKDQPPGQPPVY